MRKTTMCAALASAALLISVPAASACDGAGVPAGGQSADAARVAVKCLINRKRSSHGLRAVRLNGPLDAAGQWHSDTMDSQNFFAHEGSDGSPASRAAATGYMSGGGSWGIGENLGFGTDSAGSPRSIVAAWMGSAEHRLVLLDPRWRQVGIGVSRGSPNGADGPGMATYSVDFGFHHR